MAAYVSVSFTPKDPERLQQYAAAVPATLAPYHGKVLAVARQKPYTVNLTLKCRC